MEKATRRHFFQHGKDGHQAEKDNCHWCQLRSFPTYRDTPITIVNEVDDETLPHNFRFINANLFRGGVEPTQSEFRSGCECSDGTDCQFNACHCLGDVDEEGDVSDEEDQDQDRNGNNEDDRSRKVCAYHSSGSQVGLLRSRLLHSSCPLYECHEECDCPASCPNRVVERGRTVPLQIFRTENIGWGVRSTEPIRKGQFVDCYLGEIITSDEANRRREASISAQRKDVYLFALDKFTDSNSRDERLHGPPNMVDGEFMSGPTRFINHSCGPNMRIFARVGEPSDRHVHDLALFAIEDIAPGVELTFDYVDGVSEPDGPIDSQSNAEHMTKCLCGSKNCRGYLW